MNDDERIAYLENVLREMMQCYERRVRSACTTPEELAKEPWRCSEYVRAERVLAGEYPFPDDEPLNEYVRDNAQFGVGR